MAVQIHPRAVVDDGAVIGDGTKIWHFNHVHAGAHIGENCSLGQNVNVANDVHIGNGVNIQNNVSVYKGVELGDWVFCGPSCVFTNDLTPCAKCPKGEAGYLHTPVSTGASIGANATIVCGHEIGERAMIGADVEVIGCTRPCVHALSSRPSDWMGMRSKCGIKKCLGIFLSKMQCGLSLCFSGAGESQW